MQVFATLLKPPCHSRARHRVVHRHGQRRFLNGEDGRSLTYEKEIRDSGLTEHKHYISAGGIQFAIVLTRTVSGTGTLGTLPATETRYLLHDHLGSVAAITTAAGAPQERLAYDPWGKRRFTNGQPDPNDTLVGQSTDRGYALHEHLDEMGVIHMNGRVYDPRVGRFMSADAFIQAPDNLQNYNRYAYVLNNPLAYTDPETKAKQRKQRGNKGAKETKGPGSIRVKPSWSDSVAQKSTIDGFRLAGAVGKPLQTAAISSGQGQACRSGTRQGGF